jgi:hypothetical protein
MLDAEIGALLLTGHAQVENEVSMQWKTHSSNHLCRLAT